jgi:hypothetical protein
MYLEELETMTTRGEEIPTPKFALKRVHDILFVIGGRDKNWRPIDYIETYCPLTDRWTKVSGTHLHSNSDLLSNYKPCEGSGRYSMSSQRGGPGSRPGLSTWDL